MTEYELSDLMATYSSNLIQGQALFITIFTAYVVVAYAAGKQLSRFQTFFATISFLLFAILATQGSAYTLDQIFSSADQLGILTGEEELRDEVARSSGKFLFYGVRLLLVTGALVFMWQIRRPQAT